MTTEALAARGGFRATRGVAVFGWLSGLAAVVAGLVLLVGGAPLENEPVNAAFVLTYGLMWLAVGFVLYRQPGDRALSLGTFLALLVALAALFWKGLWPSGAVRWLVFAWAVVLDLALALTYARVVAATETRPGAFPAGTGLQTAYLAAAAQVDCLRNTLAVAWRELKRYFRSPASYVILAAFFLYQGLIFYIAVRYLNDPAAPHGAPMKFFFGGPFWFWPLECFIIAIITMDTIASEQQHRTIEPMLTAPVHEVELVVGKFLGALGFFVFLWLGTLAYVLMLVVHAHGVSGQSVVALGLYGGWALLWVLLGVAGRSAGLGGLVAWVALLVAGLLAGIGKGGLPAGKALGMAGVALLAAGPFVANWLLERQELARPAVRTLLLGLGILGILVAGWYGVGLVRTLFQEAGRNAPRLGPIAAGYLGAIGIGAAGIALGILFSSVTRDLKLATMLTFITLFLLIIVKIMLLPEVNIIETKWVRSLMEHLNLFDYMYDFSRGIVDTRHLTMLGSIVVVCLYAASRAVQVLKWR